VSLVVVWSRKVSGQRSRTNERNSKRYKSPKRLNRSRRQLQSTVDFDRTHFKANGGETNKTRVRCALLKETAIPNCDFCSSFVSIFSAHGSRIFFQQRLKFKANAVLRLKIPLQLCSNSRQNRKTTKPKRRISGIIKRRGKQTSITTGVVA
jgi:hypothetical protein